MNLGKTKSRKVLVALFSALVLLVVFTPLIPVKATVVEGTIENIPQPIARFALSLQFKMRLTLYNTTFTFAVDNTEYRFTTGTVYLSVDLAETESPEENGTLKLRLIMHNCHVETPDFHADIGLITLHLLLDVSEERAYVLGEATTHMSIVEIIGNFFANLNRKQV